MTISALDKDTVKLISTTQIITSVSCAVKELIENAFDANAKNIEVNLVDNGATLIEVKDDGCGISKEDAVCMALSSYTSKIVNFSDLESLTTYGFRGEALSALSTVADLTVITKTEQDEVATCYTIDHHGHVIKSEPCHRSTGTTVQVKQLFQQVPVRRHIITDPKKSNQDIKMLEALLKSYAMCKFFVRLNYKVNNNVIYSKPSTNTLKESITYTLGKKVTTNMSWIEVEDAEINMVLLVPSKQVRDISEICHTGSQYIFVNNRPIKHRELEKIVTKTILEALKQEAPSRKKPIFLLHILMDAANIDVNLEPNKTSIFFRDQQGIVDAVNRHLRTFYGIQVEEVQEKNGCNESFNHYQDYTQHANENVEESEWPACKKRKVHAEQESKGLTEIAKAPRSRIQNSSESSLFADANNDCNEMAAISGKILIYGHDKHGDIEGLTSQLPSPDLSESESNDSQKVTLTVNDQEVSDGSTKAKTKAKDRESPAFELSPSISTPATETLSQLPVVDLGDDFTWEDIGKSNVENESQNVNVRCTPKKDKTNLKKHTTLEAWSKGHVPGLKGGTDVQFYAESPDVKAIDKDEPYQGNHTCKGFVIFSRQIRSQVTKENPKMTAPQIAHAISALWKKLSPEERGYYRDIARDEQTEHETRKNEKKEKILPNATKNRQRLLNVLENVKTLNVERKENLVMRTTVPWDIDLARIRNKFLEKSAENTDTLVGQLSSNLWIVRLSGHIWLLDTVRLKKGLQISDPDTDVENVEHVEELLKRWISVKDDLSLLHPIYSFT